ncbi:hypothetical protein H6G93_14320 [Nostoc sp. FACHB-973]|nr:hypothetical protein [Nostoc sp. FACHB-973]
MTTITEIASDIYRILQELAALRPRTLATMHGTTFVGDGERALQDLGVMLREVLVKE